MGHPRIAEPARAQRGACVGGERPTDMCTKRSHCVLLAFCSRGLIKNCAHMRRRDQAVSALLIRAPW